MKYFNLKLADIEFQTAAIRTTSNICFKNVSIYVLK